jgi:glutaredoxin/glutathione-dependent peroxiredoxin
MTIAIGDRLPSVTLKEYTDNGLENLNTDAVFLGKKVVLFGVPGAFTPVCSDKHLPSYVRMLGEFWDRGIEVACLAVNDAFVMNAWAKTYHADGITMLPDGNGEMTKAMGLEMDASANGLGVRCQRFALYAENGIVKVLEVEKPRDLSVSRAEIMLERISHVAELAAA